MEVAKKLTKKQKEEQAIFKCPEEVPKKTFTFKSARSIPKMEMGVTAYGTPRIVLPPQEDHFNNHWYLSKNLNRILVIGGAGCGKSHELLDIIPLFDKSLTNICVFSLIQGNEVYDRIEGYCQDSNIEYEFCSEIDKAEKLVEDMIERKPDMSQALLIFDDFNDSDSRSKSSNYNKFISTCFNMLRNYFVNICVITQAYTNLVMSARGNSNVMVMFQNRDIYALRGACTTLSLLSPCPISWNNFMVIYQLLSKNIHSHLIASNGKVYVDLIDGNPPTELEIKNDKEIIFKGVNILLNQLSDSDLDAITDDENLKTIINTCDLKPIKTNINKLNKYIVRLSKAHKVDLSELVEAINRKYNLELQT